MRHHFHRCMNLRVVSVRASELHGARHGGGVVLEELCEAKSLTRCVGLADCDILTAGQKQELLVERATRIREEEGRPIEGPAAFDLAFEPASAVLGVDAPVQQAILTVV